VSFRRRPSLLSPLCFHFLDSMPLPRLPLLSGWSASPDRTRIFEGRCSTKHSHSFTTFTTHDSHCVTSHITEHSLSLPFSDLTTTHGCLPRWQPAPECRRCAPCPCCAARAACTASISHSAADASATESPRLPPSLPLYKQYHITVVNVPRDLRRAVSLATSLPLQIDQSLIEFNKDNKRL
jgi:hypothetical protein